MEALKVHKTVRCCFPAHGTEMHETALTVSSNKQLSISDMIKLTLSHGKKC